MVTVKDVAKSSGVSLATVSRVINNVDNVSDEMRNKVNKAIEELGYYPNHAARALVKQSVGAIAVVMRNLHSTYFSELLQGIEDASKDIDRNILYCSLGKEAKNRDKYIQFLMNGHSDALIIYGSLFSDQPLINHLYKRNFPFLLIENNIENLNLNQFLVNNVEGAKQAVQYLIDNNHKRIAYFLGDPNKKVNLERYTGYTLAMQRNGLPIHSNFIKNSFENNDEVAMITRRLMNEPQDKRPTGIFCCNDKIAMTVIQTIIDMGYNVPRDVSVVGFDNRKVTDMNYKGPSITTVEQPLYKMGYESIVAINDMLDNKSKLTVNKTFETKLLIKKSVRKI